MTKVIFNNEEIDLIDTLDPGEKEFDFLDSNDEDLENTLILDLEGVNNEQRTEN